MKTGISIGCEPNEIQKEIVKVLADNLPKLIDQGREGMLANLCHTVSAVCTISNVTIQNCSVVGREINIDEKAAE